MCIIAYKERNVEMPDRSILEQCFINNPDGAGFMFIENNEVVIRKGYMTFNSFYSALLSKKYLWNTSPFVLHFRISTQAGVNKECTHPFPLSSRMDDLRQLKTTSDIGIAHNGIISLTTNYAKTINHSDTMEFITDYLSLIIENNKYYKNRRTLDLIERLADSKLAILDRFGHCELIGSFTNDNGVYYSNSTYKKKEYTSYLYSWRSEDYDGYYDNYSGYYSYHKPTEKTEKAEKTNKWEIYRTGNKYFFDIACPFSEDGDDSYCSRCYDFRTCFGHKAERDEL